MQSYMSSQYKLSFTPAPSQCQRHHAIQAEASCITSSNRKRLLNGIAFQRKEYREGVAILKNNKASGKDDVLVEQLRNLGPKSHRWQLTMLNKCLMENKSPTLWRRSNIIAILKPGKDCDSKELQTNIPLVAYVHTLRKN